MQTPTSGTVTGRYVRPFSPAIHRFGPTTENLPSRKGYLFRNVGELVCKEEGPWITQSSFSDRAQAGDLVLIISARVHKAPKVYSRSGSKKNKWRRLTGRDGLISQLQVLALIQ